MSELERLTEETIRKREELERSLKSLVIEMCRLAWKPYYEPTTSELDAMVKGEG